MAKRIFDLPETKGEFKVRGLVTGTGKDKFYQAGETKKKTPKRSINFGIKVQQDGSSVYCSLNAYEKEKVYFYKKGDKKNGIKGESKAVIFNLRNTFKEEGFEPIGVKVGIEQEINEKGMAVNKNVTKFDFDVPEYLRDNLTENMPVFIRGKITRSSSINGSTGEKVRYVNFEPQQISGITKGLDLDEENYQSVNDFRQSIIFMGASTDNSDKNDPKGIIEAKIVTYNSIEDAEFVVRDKKIFTTLKKNLKPYNAITIFGKIHNKLEIEEVEDDGWGMENNSFEQKGNSFTKEMLVLGADPSTLDKETYTKENVEEALNLLKESQKAKDDFGATTDGDDWGSSLNNTDSNDDGFDDGWG